MSAAGTAPPLSERGPSWLDDTDALLAYLRAHGFVLGTGEVLRVMGLLERLRDAAGPLGEATPEAAALWLAPVICTSEAEQAALGPALGAYAAERRRMATAEWERSGSPPPSPVAPAPTPPRPTLAFLRRPLVVLPILLAMALVALAAWWLWPSPGPGPAGSGGTTGTQPAAVRGRAICWPRWRPGPSRPPAGPRRCVSPRCRS